MDGHQVLGLAEHAAWRPSLSQRPRKALLVLGMSRSGTSLAANVLHTLGASLPRDLLGSGHGNPLGHFEPRELVALNDRILAALGRAWNDPRPVPSRWFRSPQAYDFMERIVEQVRRSYGPAPLLVLKDPRLCLLLPLYLDVFAVLDIEPLAVLQVRPVDEVVRSLVERDDIPPDLAEFLWLRSVVEAEWLSRGCRRVWVSMAEILADWPGTARRIADTLRLEWPPHGLTGVGSLVRPHLYHHVAGPTRDDAPGRFASAAWIAAEHGLAGDEPAARTAFDTLRRTLQDLDRLYGPHLAAVSRPSAPRRLVSLLMARFRR